MNPHTIPIDPITYAASVAERALDLAGVEVSTADSASCRQIAAEYLEQLQQPERDLTPEQLTRAVDSGRAHLTRDFRG